MRDLTDVYIQIRCTGTVRYGIDLVNSTGSTSTGIATVPVVPLPVLAKVIIVEYSLQDAAERCVVRLGPTNVTETRLGVGRVS